MFDEVEINSDNIGWKTVPVSLPVAKHLDKNRLYESLRKWDGVSYWGAADKLAWVLRCESGHQIELGCLAVGPSRILHMPGELFVEYQLAAKKMRPDLKIAMAAYGDYGQDILGLPRHTLRAATKSANQHPTLRLKWKAS